MGSAETDDLSCLSRLASLFLLILVLSYQNLYVLKMRYSCYERAVSNKIPHNFREIENENSKIAEKKRASELLDQ